MQISVFTYVPASLGAYKLTISSANPAAKNGMCGW